MTDQQLSILNGLSDGGTLLFSGPFNSLEGWRYEWTSAGVIRQATREELDDVVQELLANGWITLRPGVMDASVFEITTVGRSALVG